MSKFGTLLGFKATAETTPGSAAAVPQNLAPEKPAAEHEALELDQELFFPVATQLGEENETVRNLLIDAEHKISELDTIKRSINKLVDPVSKTLRAFEETKHQKISLQALLNKTRTAYHKQRIELAALEKRAATLDGDCTRLRDLMTVAQQRVGALENTKAELSADLAARRAQITELQGIVQQQSADLQATREENRRFLERITTVEHHAVRLEAEASAAQQNLQLSEQERQTVKAQLEKSLAETAQLSRKLLDAGKALAASQKRLSQIEAAFGEAQTERARLSSALDEANERYRADMAALNTRHEALSARAALSEKLLEEARQTLTARADEISAFDRRVAEATLARRAVEGRITEMEQSLAEREAEIKALNAAQAGLAEQNATLSQAITARESAYLRAEEKIQEQAELIQLLESQLRGAREANELQVEDLNAQLQRERLERNMAEGALEAGRKDIARLLREVAAMQYRPPEVANDAALIAQPPSKPAQNAA
jgi:chromosome segregation ATPase